MKPSYYTITLTWSSDRRGLLCSSELNAQLSGNGCIEVATPPQFPKGVAGLWSPEHLFTAAVASCFMTTFLAIAENSGLEFVGFSCAASGKLDETDGKLLMTEVEIRPELTIVNPEDREKALRILVKTEKACLISNSIRSKVSMLPVVNTHPGLVPA